MKFDELYNNLCLVKEAASPDTEPAETEDSVKADTVAMPEDFDDVKPMPVPKDKQETSDVEQTREEGESASTERSATLRDYIFKLEEFADSLNGMESNSLQSLVAGLDKPLTPFDGISGRTKSDIVRVAETLRSISETLKLFIIGSARA